jgi:hypothetical protein
MKDKLSFLISILLMMIVFGGIIRYVFDMSGLRFIAGFVVLIGLLVLELVSALLIYNEIKFGYILNAFISLVALLYFALVYLRAGMATLLFLGSISSIASFAFSIVSIAESKPKEKKQKPQKKVEIEKIYWPGKFVSSKTSSYYHIPSCDWAKKIKDAKQVWYGTEEEAKKAGMKRHSCIKSKVY